jgi:hypothetical protein
MKALILGAAAVLLTANAAMAQAITQPVTFNIFGKAVRQIGTYTTASATIPEGVGSIGIRDTMTDADASDPTNRMVFTVYVSADGVAWQPAERYIWSGGTHTDKHTGLVVPDHINFTFSNTALQSGAWTGWSIRAEIDQQVRLSVGFDCTVYPPSGSVP